MYEYRFLNIIVYGLVFVWLGLGCSTLQKGASTYDFPKPIDTGSQTITYQTKQVFETKSGLSASNKFNAARLNHFQQINDTLFAARISAENQPINSSAWYAFKLWAKNSATNHIRLEYIHGKHRYYPKLSQDGEHWVPLDSNRLSYDSDSTNVTLRLDLDTDTVWVAAQEIYDHSMGQEWCQKISKSPLLSYEGVGLTPLGREIPHLRIQKGPLQKKKVVVIFSRQHPPEVTGYLAMQAFVEGLLLAKGLDAFLNEYVVLIYPMINPDGVDLGHWRHNSAGVDLNRDWAYYRQSETKMVSSHLVRKIKDNQAKVLLGLDFHSTYHDVFYTLDENEISAPTIPWLRNQWFESIEQKIPGYQTNERAAGLGAPVTKGWFYTQFGAEGITYEIGDDTPRNDIRKIGSVSAQELINILLQSSL